MSQWIERPPGVREVMGSIPVGASDLSLSHTRVMLNISSFTFNYRAQNSPSSFTYQDYYSLEHRFLVAVVAVVAVVVSQVTLMADKI